MPESPISLCDLRVLSVSVVVFFEQFFNHKGTEDTKIAQRRRSIGLFEQSEFKSLSFSLCVMESAA